MFKQLLQAIQANNDEEVEKILTAPENQEKLNSFINAKDDDDWTPLQYAAASGNDFIVAYLLAAGAVINLARVSTGSTPLYLAAEKGHLNVVNLLVKLTPTDDGLDVNSMTALLIAAKNGHAGVVESLLEKGAAINQAERNGLTALMLAARHGYEGIVKCLLSKGAKINQAANDGCTALMLAAQHGYEGVVEQ